jgi:hypothetical protein
MVTHSFERRPVRLGKDRLHLHRLKIAGRGDRCPLDRDSEDFGTLRDQLRIAASRQLRVPIVPWRSCSA